MTTGTIRESTSNDVRKRVLEAFFNGITIARISDVTGVKRPNIYAIIKAYHKYNTTDKQPRGKARARILQDEHSRRIKALIDENCFISLKNIKAKLLEEFNIIASLPTIHRAIANFNYTFKRVSLQPQKRNDEATITIRNSYANEFYRLLTTYNHNNFYFIDEVGFNVSIRPTRGRSLVNTIPVATVPNIRSRNISICCAINEEGIVYFVKQNVPFNSVSFCRFASELLEKVRATGVKNAVFIMDNVAFHKTQDARNVFNNSGDELIFLPPYSPFLNPIENMFSKWKNLVKQSLPTNQTQLLDSIDSFSTVITATDCRGYFRNMKSYLYRCLNNEMIED
jgi:transposase